MKVMKVMKVIKVIKIRNAAIAPFQILGWILFLAVFLPFALPGMIADKLNGYDVF